MGLEDDGPGEGLVVVVRFPKCEAAAQRAQREPALAEASVL